MILIIWRIAIRSYVSEYHRRRFVMRQMTWMKRFIASIAAAFALALGTTLVQAQQPYAGLEVRSIKALSDQQIGDLRAGRGMGLALAAELNGYPGPMHVLELADSLSLSDQQRAKIQELFA